MGHSRLDRIRNWEQLATQAQYKLVRLARLVNISPRHLRRYLETKKHKRPHDWLLALHLQPVIPLLDEGKSVKEVAHMTGFKQASHLSHAFKKANGRPPSHLPRKPSQSKRAVALRRRQRQAKAGPRPQKRTRTRRARKQ